LRTLPIVGLTPAVEAEIFGKAYAWA
jgi:hypothetical protein